MGNPKPMKHWSIAIAGFIVAGILLYFAIKSVQPISRVQTIAYGKVVATEFDGQSTTVTFDDNYKLTMNGYIQLSIPEDYEFSYYNDQWHFEGVYKGK